MVCEKSGADNPGMELNNECAKSRSHCYSDTIRGYFQEFAKVKKWDNLDELGDMNEDKGKDEDEDGKEDKNEDKEDREI
jgi:hypothetical protein